MIGIFKRVIVWALVSAIFVGGLPVAHADNCVGMQDREATHAAQLDPHENHAFKAEAVSHGDHVDDVASMHDAQDESPVSAPGFCKCLNCTNFCVGFVAPLPSVETVSRRPTTAVFSATSATDRSIALFVDPGIPIAA